MVSFLMGTPVRAMIYMWKDSAGIAHYSNKEYDIPARYKAKARMMYPDASDTGTAQSAASPSAPAAPATVTQVAKPEVQPDVRPAAPPAQVKGARPATPERRIRKQRERSRDDDE
jgi:hypothetical protein